MSKAKKISKTTIKVAVGPKSSKPVEPQPKENQALKEFFDRNQYFKGESK